MSPLSLLFCSSFTLIIPCLCLLVDGVRAEIATHHLVTVSSLLESDECSTLQVQGLKSNKKHIKVVHRHGPCFAHQEKKLSHREILDKDRHRVDSIHRLTSTSTSTWSASLSARDHRTKKKPGTSMEGGRSSIPAHTGDSLDSGNYVVTVGFGTPKKDLSVVFDTGSDVTWIQCRPCVGSCYAQQDPIFDPAQSSTYSNISCTSPYCSQLDTFGCSASNCLYAVLYGDNSQTVGFFAEETLTLAPNDLLPKFRFGCGEKNSGLFGKVAGLLALGRGPVSIVSQSLSKYGGVFSYCLPSKSSSTGYLSLGGGPVANAHFTPMLTGGSYDETFYYLNLTAIAVGGKLIPVPPTVFTAADTVIDSGTVISRLPPAAYSVLRAAFQKGMTKYPTAPALSILDTCYNFTGYSTVAVPTVGLVFEGGFVFNLNIYGILYTASVSRSCLAFAGNSAANDTSILGNTQQRTFSVSYDVSKKLVGFAPGGCT